MIDTVKMCYRFVGKRRVSEKVTKKDCGELLGDTVLSFAKRCLFGIQVLFWISVVSGCSFDQKWQYDLAFPATVVLKNEANQAIKDIKVVGTPKSSSPFVIRRKAMGPGETVEFPVPRTVHKDVSDGNFSFYGSYKGEAECQIDGQIIKMGGGVEAERLRVTIVLSKCSCWKKTIGA